MAFLRALLLRWKWTLAAALACAAVVSVQCLLWYAQVGHFIADGYRGEGFHWDRPEVAASAGRLPPGTLPVDTGAALRAQ